MKRWILLAVLVVAVTTTTTVAVQYLSLDPTTFGSSKYPALTRPSGPQPMAAVEGDLTHHFGVAAQDAKIEKEWAIRNDGEADLILTKGPTPCSCTIADFENGKDTITLKPGERITLHLTFETRDYNGAYRKPATVVTNDMLHPTLEFVGEGTVRPAVMLYPPEKTINYVEISNDTDEHPAGVALYSVDRPDIAIAGLDSSRPGEVVVSHEPMTAEDCKGLGIEKGHRINVNVTSAMPLGVFREEVVIKTDHPKQPELRLTVTGKMVGPISTTPDRVWMVPVSSRQGATKAIILTVRGSRATTFEVAKKPEKFQVEVTPRDESNQDGQYRLTVTVPPGLPSSTIMEEIVLKTDHPKASELKIPVDIVIEQ